MSTVITQQVEETEQQLIDMAAAAVRQSNWAIGEAASKWTERYASGRTDADFAELIGASRETVNYARRIYTRFCQRADKHDFAWRAWQQIVAWDDAEECLDWAEATNATFAEMNAWRNVQHGQPAVPEPVKPPTQQAPEPNEPLVRPNKKTPEPSGEVEESALSDEPPTATQPTQLAPAVESPPVESSKPHVVNNSGEIEWYTPAELIDASREVMGDIDLDPASCETANEVVNAAEFYDKEQDGLSLEWHGRVFMNPPYAAGLVGDFIDKLLAEFNGESVTEACVLVNNATETKWFQALADAADALCFPKSRIRFWNPNRDESMTGLQGQAVVYLGPNVERFRAVFSRHGVTVTR